MIGTYRCWNHFGKNIDEPRIARRLLWRKRIVKFATSTLVPCQNPESVAKREAAKNWVDEKGNLIQIPRRPRACFGLPRARLHPGRQGTCSGCPMVSKCTLVCSARLTFGGQHAAKRIKSSDGYGREFRDDMATLAAIEELGGWERNAYELHSALKRACRKQAAQRYRSKIAPIVEAKRKDREIAKSKAKELWRRRLAEGIIKAKEEVDYSDAYDTLMKAHQRLGHLPRFRKPLSADKFQEVIPYLIAEQAVLNAGNLHDHGFVAEVCKVYRELTGDTRPSPTLRSAVDSKLRLLEDLREHDVII